MYNPTYQPKVNNKWHTPIGHWSFGALVAELGLIDEVMSNPDVMKNTQVGALRISDRKEQFPKFWDFIETHLYSAFLIYIRNNFSHDPVEVTWSAWAHLCLHGQGLEPHYHMGDEHVTSIIYLTDSKANLVLRDPRANLVRNWPQEILKDQFREHVVHPRAGDFVLFPTYVDHYVMAAEPDFRVAVAVDWCFK